jgi:hypothetical protein
MVVFRVFSLTKGSKNKGVLQSFFFFSRLLKSLSLLAPTHLYARKRVPSRA